MKPYLKTAAKIISFLVAFYMALPENGVNIEHNEYNHIENNYYYFSQQNVENDY